jgi:hypothetical protein
LRKRQRKKLARKKADRKLRELIVYVAQKHRESPEPLTMERLNILLYLIDVTAYGTLGHPLTGRNWRKTATGVEMSGYWQPPTRPRP